MPSAYDAWLYSQAEDAFNNQVEASEDELYWFQYEPSDEEYQVKTQNKIIQCVI